jgi:hypothetical protein
MPRGADFDDGVPHSDNTVPSTHNITHGAGGTTADVPLSSASKTAPLPEGLKDEVNDRNLSAGGGAGHGSGKGGNEPKTLGTEKGLAGGQVPADQGREADIVRADGESEVLRK